MVPALMLSLGPVQHSVANMFIIPMGMALGADVTVSQFLLGNLLPVTLGNIVAGDSPCSLHVDHANPSAPHGQASCIV